MSILFEEISQRYAEGVQKIHDHYMNTHTITGKQIEIEMDNFIKEVEKKNHDSKTTKSNA